MAFKVKTFKVLIQLIVIFIPFIASSKTIILNGTIQSKIHVTQQMVFNVPAPLKNFSFRFAVPKDFSNRFVTQRIQNLDVKIEPEPVELKREIDQFSNRWVVASWKSLSKSVKVKVNFEVSTGAELKAENSVAEFPLRVIPPQERIFLKPTKMVQSEIPEILRLAREITKGSATEYEAVTRILNWVVDHVKYTYNPPQYDALYTLKTGKGNCQNFAHLSMALMRASGIPSRIVGGITLKESWKIPVDEKNYLVQAMGQGGHAWIEIYFPDLGWLSYDPQQSKQFTSSRHIKQTHGLDSDDINDSWRASPYLPEYSDSIEARFLSDHIDLRPEISEPSPRAYILSNKLVVGAKFQEMKPPQEKPQEFPKEKEFEFGNIEFPTLVDIYRVIGNKGFKILDKETAEYVTSTVVYAQAFSINKPIMVKTISLAMRKFGGDGTVYLDLVQDEDGRPGFQGIRSSPVFVDTIQKRPGYYWVDFTFHDNTFLKPGIYWIILRHSGEVIMNWFYIPGNPYGDPLDTRSTLKGYRWQDIQNFDFVFKVRAKR